MYVVALPDIVALFEDEDEDANFMRSNVLSHTPQEHQPAYEALSYTWGSEDRPCSVNIDNGSQFVEHRQSRGSTQTSRNQPEEPVGAISDPAIGEKDSVTISTTSNLDVALRYLRYQTQPRVIWIDALCINQLSEDTDEKNRQVAAMGRIFSIAEHVVIWLGPGDDDSDKAFDMIHQIVPFVDFDWDTGRLRSRMSCPDEEKHWGDILAYLPFEDRELNTVLDLFERPYFNRVWVRQEIALAKSATVCCGDKQTDWAHFCTFSRCLWRKRCYRSGVSDSRASSFNKAKLAMEELCRVRVGTMCLSVLRDVLGDAKCRDPRDKIFAILALLHDDGGKLLGIQPDYSQRTEDLYMDVARRSAEQKRSLEILQSCVLSSSRLDIPSWVPDWSTPISCLECLWTYWSACGWISSRFTFLSDNTVCATGIAARKIRRVTRCDILGDTEKTLVRQYAQTFDILRGLSPSEQDLVAANIDRARWTEVFCSSLMCGPYAECSKGPLHDRHWKLSVLLQSITMILSSTLDYESLMQETTLPLYAILSTISHNWSGTHVLVCDDGSVGFSYPVVQKNDVITVLLGCRYPVVLRPMPRVEGEEKDLYKIVSVALVAGLMKGEAIYGDRLPSQWRAVHHELEKSTWVDTYPHGLYDPDTDLLRTNPAEILAELGIKVENYQQKPHRLEVLPGSLRAAGVPLREFILA